MWQVIFSTYHKNRIGILRAVPWSFMVSRVITGVTQIIFPYFVYRYFMHGNLNNEFSEYANGADYITYIVLGSGSCNTHEYRKGADYRIKRRHTGNAAIIARTKE